VIFVRRDVYISLLFGSLNQACEKINAQIGYSFSELIDVGNKLVKYMYLSVIAIK